MDEKDKEQYLALQEEVKEVQKLCSFHTPTDALLLLIYDKLLDKE